MLQLLRTSTDDSRQEELLLNTVAACTNVTYYACQQLSLTEDDRRPSSSSGREQRSADKLEQRLVDLSVQLTQCLFHENEEVVLETARVLGESLWLCHC